jgi:hypothetical protein
LALLQDQNVPVLLCERDHADGNWEDLLKATARLLAPPSLIVIYRLADASLWAQVLNLGGFDVLMTPFEPEEVLRVSFAMAIPFARMDHLSSFAWDGPGQNPRYSEAEAAEPAGGQQKGTGTGMQRLHLKCENCRPAICGCRFYSSPFSGSAAKRVVFGLSRSTVSEWQVKCHKKNCEIRRCASNCIPLDGPLPNAATAND